MFELLRTKLQPLTNILAMPFMWLHPNAITLLGIFVYLPGIYFYSQGDSLLGSLFVVGALFDLIDGTVARNNRLTSQFGGVLDATVDRFAEGIICLGIGMGGLVSWENLFIFYILSICISYIKAKAEASSGETKVGKNKFSVGITQRADRMFIIFAASIANHFFGSDNVILEYSFIGLSIACAITVVWRTYVIYEVLESKTAK